MSTIQDKSTFEVIRKRAEDKNTLQQKGSLYVGTGKSEQITEDVVVFETTTTPPISDNALLVSDANQDGGLGWKNVDDVLTAATNAGQHTSVKNVESTIKDIEIVSFFKQQLLELAYPIGSIYMSATEVSPQTFLGGTWVRWGNGRVPVGVSESESQFNNVEVTGGAMSTTLTWDNMPQKKLSTMYDYLGATYVTAGLVDAGVSPVFKTEVAGNCYLVSKTGSGSSTSTYTCTTPYFGKENPDAISNLQPYITCYMWKRTA